MIHSSYTISRTVGGLSQPSTGSYPRIQVMLSTWSSFLRIAFCATRSCMCLSCALALVAREFQEAVEGTEDKPHASASSSRSRNTDLLGASAHRVYSQGSGRVQYE